MINEKSKENEINLSFSVVNNDVIDVPSDVLILKHASGFFGVDMVVSKLLIAANICTLEELSVAKDQYIIIDSKSVIYPKKVLVLGVGKLPTFGYPEMRRFAERTIKILSDIKLPATRITTTIHGSGYGLDAEESLLQLVQGFQKGLMTAKAPSIHEIIFVELESRRAQQLTHALSKLISGQPKLPKFDISFFDKSQNISSEENNKNETKFSGAVKIIPDSDVNKPHVFVAMPFSEDFEDVYEFGIYGPVRNCGLICEKTSESAYTGDVLQRIIDRIETADYVVAELTGARPNVYLEVGYAWGKGIPVIFFARF